MNTNFQTLTDQECQEINGGLNVTINLLGIPVNLNITSVNNLATSLGGSILSVSSAISGLLVNIGNIAGNLLGNLGK
ncbi:hypothetical protein [Pseudobacter ginsenosidimutans]|uniref:Uncharacterized protein n=1 Tax=Pseudobacter ginsenosidimutans TaxID=661488 RepID=A0A4Q7MR68_9BACT|nr:hypothetical protein [Pseudobacter ginsenosidimutans]QEC42248.1 hypothetical protein FSB84_11295 [Pseudobacter ginsenosidimutans]RZS70908.1 hypothetical protein EV199_2807 [Pseudobacter ginsenosidimutans]